MVCEEPLLAQVHVMSDYFQSKPDEIGNEKALQWILHYSEKFRGIWEKGLRDTQKIEEELYSVAA